MKKSKNYSMPIWKIILILFLGIYFIVFILNQVKALPKDISYESEFHEIPQNNVDFIYDLTFTDSKGNTVYHQEIFENVFELIRNAENYILLDMFLYNPELGKSNYSYLPLSSMLTNELLDKKNQSKDIKIDLITDEINIVYGGVKSDQIDKLKNNDVNIHFSNLEPLRDSNPVYSTFYRMFIIWFGNNDEGGIMSNPFNPQKDITIRSYLKMANFKANHRKVITANSGDEFVTIITSANPHDGSSAHSNIGVKIKSSDFAKEIYTTENAVSENKLYNFSFNLEDEISNSNNLKVKLITEGKIRENILEELSILESGDEINLGMFYISDRKVINEIKSASKRGVKIKIVLDPNKDAFGYKKNGIPNRQVAYELLKEENIEIRWYNTTGEQFHTKIILIKKADGSRIVILGSANYTKRNIGDYNLELNVLILGNSNQNFFREVQNYFDMIWSNENGNNFTVDYLVYEDNSKFKYLLYRFQEFSGFCTF